MIIEVHSEWYETGTPCLAEDCDGWLYRRQGKTLAECNVCLRCFRWWMDAEDNGSVLPSMLLTHLGEHEGMMFYSWIDDGYHRDAPSDSAIDLLLTLNGLQ